MGKASRRRGKAGPKVKVVDAAQVVNDVTWLAAQGEDRRQGTEYHWISGVAYEVQRRWQRDQVALRVDRDFVDALLSSDTGVELHPGWTERIPYESVAVSFPEPIDLWDGTHLCRYRGFVATGIRSRQATAADFRSGLVAPGVGRPEARPKGVLRTFYTSLQAGDGVRALWVYRDERPEPRGQTISVMHRGPLGTARTLQEWMSAGRAIAAQEGQDWGLEVPTLHAVTAQILLYLASSEPDLQSLPADGVARPHALERASVHHLGWRVGASLRLWHDQAARVTPSSAVTPTSAGRDIDKVTTGHEPAVGVRRPLPPHIRRAHWHRVRVAVRDAGGRIVGNRTGVEGVNWTYEIRWYPPTPVNVGDSGPSPVVRSLLKPPTSAP